MKQNRLGAEVKPHGIAILRDLAVKIVEIGLNRRDLGLFLPIVVNTHCRQRAIGGIKRGLFLPRSVKARVKAQT